MNLTKKCDRLITVGNSNSTCELGSYSMYTKYITDIFQAIVSIINTSSSSAVRVNPRVCTSPSEHCECVSPVPCHTDEPGSGCELRCSTEMPQLAGCLPTAVCCCLVATYQHAWPPGGCLSAYLFICTSHGVHCLICHRTVSSMHILQARQTKYQYFIEGPSRMEELNVAFTLS